MAGITGVPHVIPHRIHIDGGDAAEIQSRIRGATGQTANIFEVQTVAGATLFSVDNDGDVSITGNLDAVVNETLTGNITLAGNLTVNGNTTLGNAGTDTLTVTAASTFSGTVNLTNTLVSTSNGTFSGFVSSTVLNLPRRGATPATMGSTGRIYTFAGDAGTTELWYRDAAGNDVQITDAGALEGASLFWDDDEYIRMGNTAAAPDVRIGWNTAQTVDAWYFGTADAQNVFIIAENGDRAFDFAHAAEATPTLFIHSAAASTTQWMSFRHTGTFGEIETGVGSLILQNTTVLPAAELISVDVTPTYSAENFNKTGLRSFVTQNGANSGTLRALILAVTKGTGATILSAVEYLTIAAPSVAGTITDMRGILISDLSTAGGTTSFGIRILSQTANATTTRAVEIVGTGVNNAIRLGASANMYANAAEQITFADSTNVDGIRFALGTGDQAIRTVATDNTSLFLQNQTFTPANAHDAVSIVPTWTTENFAHTGLRISVTQNGANTQPLNGMTIRATKDAAVSTLGTAEGLEIGIVAGAGSTITTGNGLAIIAPTGGTIATSNGILISNQSLALGTSAFAINIESQTANATTTRAINLAGTGVSNAIRFGASANAYGNAAENIRFTNSTNANGLDFNLSSTADQTINTVTATTGRIWLQNQTFTPAATHSAVSITPTWVSADNFEHNALLISTTQDGTNTNALNGLNIVVNKTTAGTTLAAMRAINLASPVITTTVTNSNAIRIDDWTNANATTPRAIVLTTAGVANSIVWGGSALQYANAAQNIRFADSTNANGLDFNLLATAIQTINTISATTGSISIQSNTFTPGATHSAVSIGPTWAAEGFSHTGLQLSITQNGANSVELRGLNVSLIQSGAGTLALGLGARIGGPSAAGTVTTMYGLTIENQSLALGTTAFAINIASQTANATTTRAIEIAGTGVNNAIRLGASPNIYSSAAQIVRITDSTNANGFVFTTAAGASQAIGTVTTTTGTIIFQNQTFTSGATHNAVQITPTWTSADNFIHTGLIISATQAGTNTTSLRGLTVANIKTTGATVLDTSASILIAAPDITGTVTTAFGIDLENHSIALGTTAFALRIQSQSANATTTRAIELVGTGVSNAIRFGASANAYSNAAQNIRFTDSTNARGIDFTLTAAGVQTIAATAGDLTLNTVAGGTEIIQLSTDTTQISTHVRILNTTTSQTGNSVLIGNVDNSAVGTQQVNLTLRAVRTGAAGATGDIIQQDLLWGTIGTIDVSTITNLACFRIDNYTIGGGTTITRESLFRFLAAVGTHRLLPAASDVSGGLTNGVLTVRKITANGTARDTTIIAYLPVDINGTLGYVPVFDARP